MQQLRQAHGEEGREVTWKILQKELWTRFDPTEFEDFDKAFSKIRQSGSLHDYQHEFESHTGKREGFIEED